MTARDLIKGSLRLLGVLASGEEPSAAEAQDALASLNSMIDTWRNERLMVYAVLPQSFSMQAGKKIYTLGSGGDFDMVRPVRVEKVQMTYTQAGSPYPLNLPIEMVDVDFYNRFVVPNTQSPIPLWVYIDDNFPLRSLYFYTVPSIVNGVTLYTWQQLSSFATLDTTVSLPPGYEKALRFGLAIDLAPEYGTEPSATVASRANEAKASVKSANNTYVPLMQVDPALIPKRNGFNYLTGE